MSEGLPEQIRAALARFAGVHVAPEIPSKKLLNARAACRIPDDENVIGLVDLTTFGSAKSAVVFGTHALYICDRWTRRQGDGVACVVYEDLVYEGTGETVRLGLDGVATALRNLSKYGGMIETVAALAARAREAPQPAFAPTMAPANDLANDPDAIELQAAIAATPDDVAPRLVLADLLLSNEDPRGELIVLDNLERESGGLTDPEQLERYLFLAAMYSFPNPRAEEPALLFTAVGLTPVHYTLAYEGRTYDVRYAGYDLTVDINARRELTCRLALAENYRWTEDETTVIIRLLSDVIRAGSPLRLMRFPFMLDPLPIYDGGPMRVYRLPKDYTGPRGFMSGQFGLAARDYERWMATWRRLARMLKAARK